MLAAAGPQWSAIRDADVSPATDGGFVQRINTELGFEPARSLNETDVGRVLDTVRPSASGGAAYAGYLEWCSVVPVDLFCQVLVNDIESVSTGGDRVLVYAASSSPAEFPSPENPLYLRLPPLLPPPLPPPPLPPQPASPLLLA